MGKTSTASKRKYNEKAYDRISVTVPKGQKARIQAYVKEKGYIGVNSLIWHLLCEEMKDFDASADE